MRKTIIAATLVAATFATAGLCITTANAAPAEPASDKDAVAASANGKMPTDISARRYRYVGNRWRVVRPYPIVRPLPYYGYYGPRPYYYRPYPAYYQPYPVVVPFPFGFRFGYSPYYW